MTIFNKELNLQYLANDFSIDEFLNLVETDANATELKREVKTISSYYCNGKDLFSFWTLDDRDRPMFELNDKFEFIYLLLKASEISNTSHPRNIKVYKYPNLDNFFKSEATKLFLNKMHAYLKHNDKDHEVHVLEDGLETFKILDSRDIRR